jgi:hypothetical protein
VTKSPYQGYFKNTYGGEGSGSDKKRVVAAFWDVDSKRKAGNVRRDVA